MRGDLVETDHDRHRRRECRIFKAFISHGACLDQPIIVRNISTHGIGARGVLGLQPGSQVTFRLSDNLINGEVCWSRGDSFGASLATEIDPSQFKFTDRDWESAQAPFKLSHVFDQFRPATDARRPAVKARK